ncbi:MAG: ferredoxin family protein, partial [Planctomycetia bacterium]|nr:ferredoxin family protein [Planctomycetia bacterium]
GKSAEEIAALERDEHLVMAGRNAVGMTVGIRKRQEGKSDEPRDELDDLIDGLDELDI